MSVSKKAAVFVGTILVLYAIDHYLQYGLFGFGLPGSFDYYIRIVMLIGINITLAVGLNLINGIAGQFSIGHAGFMAVGGYTAAYTTCSLFYALFGADAPRLLANEGPGFWLGSAVLLTGLAAGALAAGLVGLVVGVPSLRLKGDYLAIVTLGFGEIIRVVIQNIDMIGGNTGFRDLTWMVGDERVVVPVQPLASFFWIFLGAVLAVVVVRNIASSTIGRALTAIRDDEIAAEAMGVNTTYYKVLAFVVGSALAGVAGGLSGHLFGNLLTPATFTFVRSIEVVTMIVLGGIGSITGSVIGAIALTILPEALRQFGVDAAYPGLRMVIYALLLILLMIFRPQGIFGRRELSLEWLFRRSRSDVPVALTDTHDSVKRTDAARPVEDTHNSVPDEGKNE
jgi:branched-chain amino acid transport system permease protein